MLILLDDSLATNAVAQGQELRNVIDNLAFAYRKGIHVVSASFQTIQAFMRLMSGDVRGVLSVIKQRRYELHSLVAEVDSYVEVIGDADSVTRIVRAGKTVFRVPPSFFSDPSRVERTRLVAEDLDDATTYHAVGAAYIHRNAKRLIGLTIQLNPFGGGGSSTADQFRQCARQGPTLAIVDSDKDYSLDNEGETARATRRALLEIQAQTVCDVYVPNCRELENLIPGSLLVDSLTGTEASDYRHACVRLLENG